MPELIPRLRYSKNWESPADYATHQNNEIQNRKDLQSLFTEIASYINDVMLPRAEQLLSDNGGGAGGTGGIDGEYLPLDGGTMRGVLRLWRSPELDREAASKFYVDSVAGNVAADVNGNLTAIRQTSTELELLAQNHESDIASLKVRADEISTSVQNLDGELSTVSQKADAIETRVADAEGNLSNVSQKADAVESRITSAEGQISTVAQQADAIETRVTNAEGSLSAISQTVSGINLSVSTVTENGEVFSRITLRIGEQELYGYIKLEGNVDISGQLSTEAIYAASGEIAHLAVDTLNTSRRVVRYLQGDTSDDNFIRAYGQNLEWVTASTNGGTAQAKNPDGAPLFWPVDVSQLSCGADGYPVSAQNERIFTTTTPTAYPVQVYTYQEDIKRAISFEPVNGIYSPVDRFGAGNAQGNNKAWILKTADGFDIRYLTPDNQEIGIHMGTDGKVNIDGLEYDADKIRGIIGLTGSGGYAEGGGSGIDLTQVNEDGSTSGVSVDRNGYTDFTGMRKVVTLDFSNLDGNVTPGFSELLDGDIYNTYQVERDGSGRISKITDASGHETVIVW